jgi:2-aminoadipate transaminase
MNPSPQTPEFPSADWTHGMKRSVLRQMIAVTAQPGILSFAGGLPAPELFPNQQFAEAMAQVLHDPLSLQYGPPQATLKAQIVQLMAQRGVTCIPEQVFITTGAQQGLDVLTRFLLNPGGAMILENIVYTGAQQVLAPFQPRILTVPTDLATGMDVDAVEAHLQNGYRPAYLYSITEAHNPLGVSLSQAKRHQLIEVAQQYGVPIIEDDPYGFLVYDDQPLPPLRALDEEHVIYLGSFSKILAPALRLGWMVAPLELIPKLTVVKEMGDLESSVLIQRAAATFLASGSFPEHLARLKTEYRLRRDTMLTALDTHFPTEARWTRPRGGMFIWVELPSHVDTAALLDVAIAQEKVAFIPGHAFGVEPGCGRNCLRLNFSNATPEKIEDGIARLGRVLTERNS